MRVFEACRACLDTTNKLEIITQAQARVYKDLTGLAISKDDGYPTHLCFECSAAIKKALAFRRKCRRAHFVLKELMIVQKRTTLTLLDILNVDRGKTNLASILGPWSPAINGFYCAIEPDPEPDEGDLKNESDLKMIKIEPVEGKQVEGMHNEAITTEEKKEKSVPKPVELKKYEPLIEGSTCLYIDIIADDGISETASVKNEELKEECQELENNDEFDREDLGAEENEDIKEEPANDEQEEIDLNDVFKGLPEPESDDDWGAPDAQPEEEVKEKKKAKELRQTVKINKIYECKKRQMERKMMINEKTIHVLVNFLLVAVPLEEQIRVFNMKLKLDDFKSKPYKCAICVINFDCVEKLMDHAKMHVAEKDYEHKCNVCKRRLATEIELLRHQAENHWYMYRCRHCNLSAVSLASAAMHHKIHEEKAQLTRWYDMKPLPQDEVARSLVDYRPNDSAKCRTCVICGLTVAKKNESHVHRYPEDKTKKAVNNTGWIQCNVCKVWFDNKKELISHIESYHSYIFECKSCHFVLFSDVHAYDHLHKHLTYKEFLDVTRCVCVYMGLSTPCVACGKKFRPLNKLYLHQLEEHGHVCIDAGWHRVVCLRCNKVFDGKEAYIEHFPTHADEMPKKRIRRYRKRKVVIKELNNDEVLKTEGNALKEDENALIDDGKALIEDGNALNEDSYEAYEANKPKTIRIYKNCRYNCGRTPPKGKMKCEVCAKERKHKMSTFICDQCGIPVKQHSLSKHKWFHKRRDQPHLYCPFCNQFVFSEKRYIGHMLHCHTERPFICKVCGDRFVYRHNASDHILKVHAPEKLFKCAECDREFSHIDYIVDHGKKVHGMDLTEFKKKYMALSLSIKGRFYTYPLMRTDVSLIPREILDKVELELCDYFDEKVAIVPPSEYQEYLSFEHNPNNPIFVGDKTLTPDKPKRVRRKRTVEEDIAKLGFLPIAQPEPDRIQVPEETEEKLYIADENLLKNERQEEDTTEPSGADRERVREKEQRRREKKIKKQKKAARKGWTGEEPVPVKKKKIEREGWIKSEMTKSYDLSLAYERVERMDFKPEPGPSLPILDDGFF